MLTRASKILRTTAAAALLAAPAFAGAVDSPSCKRELAAISQNISGAPQAKPASGASCTAYRTQFLETVRARAVVAVCRTGQEREQEIGRLDGRVEDINGAIAQACG